MSAEHIAGSGAPPTTLLEEGTALLCALSAPFGVCFAGNSVMFTDLGHRAIYLLTDVYPHATELMPVVHGIATAYGYRETPEHPADLRLCLQHLTNARDFFDKVEADIFARTGRKNAAQGPQGNVSLVVRKSLRNWVIALQTRLHYFAVLNIPDRVQEALKAAAMTTLDVENFFGLMRKRWVYPYFLQYLNNRSRTSEERAKMLTTKAFSYHTGVKRKDRHYDESGVATTVKIHRREGHQNSRRSEAVQGID